MTLARVTYIIEGRELHADGQPLRAVDVHADLVVRQSTPCVRHAHRDAVPPPIVQHGRRHRGAHRGVLLDHRHHETARLVDGDLNALAGLGQQAGNSITMITLSNDDQA